MILTSCFCCKRWKFLLALLHNNTLECVKQTKCPPTSPCVRSDFLTLQSLLRNSNHACWNSLFLLECLLPSNHDMIADTCSSKRETTDKNHNSNCWGNDTSKVIWYHVLVSVCKSAQLYGSVRSCVTWLCGSVCKATSLRGSACKVGAKTVPS